MQWSRFLSTTPRSTADKAAANVPQTDSGTAGTARNPPDQPSSRREAVCQLYTDCHASPGDYEDEIAALRLTLSHLEVSHLGAQAVIAELQENNRRLADREASELTSAKDLIKDLQLRNEEMMRRSGRKELKQAVRIIGRLRQHNKELQDKLYAGAGGSAHNLFVTNTVFEEVPLCPNTPAPDLEASQPQAVEKPQDQKEEAKQAQNLDSDDQSVLIKDLNAYIERLEILAGDLGELWEDQNETIDELMELVFSQQNFIDSVKKQKDSPITDKAIDEDQNRN